MVFLSWFCLHASGAGRFGWEARIDAGRALLGIPRSRLYFLAYSTHVHAYLSDVEGLTAFTLYLYLLIITYTYLPISISRKALWFLCKRKKWQFSIFLLWQQIYPKYKRVLKIRIEQWFLVNNTKIIYYVFFVFPICILYNSVFNSF